MGGPTVMGTDIMPNRKPMAWDTSAAPTSSKAMGAMMQMKQPSNSPMSRHTAISPPKTWHSGIIMDISPITRNETTYGEVKRGCWSIFRTTSIPFLSFTSEILAQIRLPTVQNLQTQTLDLEAIMVKVHRSNCSGFHFHLLLWDSCRE